MLLVFVALAAAIIWLMNPQNTKPLPPVAVEKPRSLTESQQRQMEKTRQLGKQMQQDLDKRMGSNPDGR